MLIHNAAITGSLTYNGIDISDITGSEASVASLNSFSSSILSYTASNNTNINALQAFSSSILTYTASNDSINTTQNNRLSSLETTSGSLLIASGSFSTRVTDLETASGSFSTRVSNTETTSSNLTTASSSFSTRVANNESTGSNLVAASASFSTRVTNNESNISSLTTASGSFSTRTTNLETASGSFSTRVTNAESNITSLNSKTGSYATTGSNTLVGAQYISNISNAISFTSTGSLYTDGGMRVAKDMYVSGTAYFNNVTVFGTQSIAYISSSQLNIGTNIISVNTDTPSIRFGGLAVYDSGSTGLTGSMLWDSEDNQWIYSNPSGSTYDSAVFLVGPRNSGVIGNEVGISCNFLSKGNGLHHMTSSGIFENGTTTCFYGNTIVSSSGYMCTSTAAFTGCVSVGTSAQCSTFVVKGAFSGGYYPSSATTVPLANFVGNNPEVLISDYSNDIGRTATLRLGTTDVDYYCYGAFVRAIQGNGVDSYSLSFGTSQNNPATTKLNINGAGVACFSGNVCAPAFVGGTMSGTTIYGSTAVCSPVGKFTTCIDAGSGIFSSCVGTTALNMNNMASLGSIGGGAIYLPYTAGLLFRSSDGSTAKGKIQADNCNNLFLNSDNGGCVGIGTTSPAYKLDVSSDINDGSIIRAINLNSGAAATARVYVENNIGSFGQLTTYSSGFGFNVFDIAAGNFTALLSSGASSAGLLAGTLTSDPMIFGTNNTERMRITCDGNIGIGTTDTQTFRLAVDGPNIGQGDTSTTIRIFDTACATAGTGGGISFAGYFSGTSSIINTLSYIKGGKENSTAGDYASYLSFGTRINGGGATERMRITSAGNIGIGTSLPAQKLDVAGKIRLTDDLVLDSTNPTITWGSGTLRFYANAAATVRAIIDASGNVGIGTTNPLNKLHVSNLVNRAYTPTSFNDTSHALHIEFCDQNQRAGLIRWTSHGNLENSFGVVQMGCSTGSGCGQGDFIFQAYRTTPSNSYSELMRITRLGNVGIGTTTPQARLQVSCVCDFGAILKISDTTTESTGILALGDGNSGLINVGIWRGAFNSLATYGDWLNLGGYAGISFATCAAGIGSQANRLRITSDGIACFACQVCSPASVIRGTINEQLILDFIAGAGSYTHQSFRLCGTNQYRLIGNTNGSFVLRNDVISSDVLTFACAGGATFACSVNAVGLFSTTSASGNLASKIRNGVASSSGTTGYGLAIESEASAASSYALTVRNLAETSTYFHILTETGRVGNVGINTTTPNYKLEVNGTSCFAGNVTIGGTYCAFALNVHGVTYQIGGSTWVQNGYGYVNAGAVSTGLFPQSDNTIQLRINNSTALIIDSDQKVGLGTTTPCTRFHSEGGYGATWGGNSCFFGGGISGGGFPYGDIYGNGASYTYQVACTNQTNGSLRGGFAAGYFKGGDGGAYGGGGAGIVAIGGNGANAESVNSGGGAGIFARGGLNGACTARAYAGWFDGGDVVIRCGNLHVIGNEYIAKSGGGGSFKQTVVGQTTAAASGTAKKIAYVGYSHSVRVYVWANQSAANGSSAIADITTLYGSSNGGTTTEANFGNVTDIVIAYNNGGSPAYTIDVTLTYSGAAPAINYVIEGISHDNSIYAIS